MSSWQVLFNSNHQVLMSASSIKGVIVFFYPVISNEKQIRKAGVDVMSSALAPSSKRWPSVLRPAMQHHPLLVSHCHIQITSPVSLGVYSSVCVCVCVCMCTSLCYSIRVFMQTKDHVSSGSADLSILGVRACLRVCFKQCVTDDWSLPASAPLCVLQLAYFNPLHTWNKLLFGCVMVY